MKYGVIGHEHEHGIPGRTRRLGKISVRVTNTQEAAFELIRAVRSRVPQIFTFCNASTVNLAHSSSEFAKVLEGAVIFNDGIGVDIGSRILYGQAFEDNLNGTDFIPAMFGALEHPMRLFLLGGKPGVAERAGVALEQRFPMLCIAGTRDGYFSQTESADVLAMIEKAKPDLVLVGMGQPLQEFWAAENINRIGVPFLCAGAFLDFASGRVSRAPRYLRLARMEWFYRLVLEPRRLSGRYIGGAIPYLSRILMQRMTGNGGKS